MSDWKSEIETVAQKVLRSVSSGKARTAWELKMQLKVSHTRLHLALGILLERGSITMRPEKLTYVVEPAAQPQPADTRTAVST